MADSLTPKRATWKNVTNSPTLSVETVNVQAASQESHQVQFNLDPLVAIIKEGFKRDLGAHSDEITDAIAMQIDAMVNVRDAVVAELSALSTYVDVGLKQNDITVQEISKNLESLIKEMRHASNTFINTMQGLKLTAELPITSLSVGLPKTLALYAILMPPLYGVITWLILSFTH